MSMIQELDRVPGAPRDPRDQPIVVQRVTSNGPYYAALAGAAIGIFASFLALFAAHQATVHRARHYALHGARCSLSVPSPSSLDPGDDLLEQAQRSYVNGDFTQAIALASRVTPRDARENSRAQRLIGAAACNLGDPRLATAAYYQLGSGSGQFLAYVCRRAGYVLEHGRFVKGN